MTRHHQYRILMVDDNSADAELVREALSEIASPISMDWVSDGIKALRFLRQEEEFADSVRPNLILLDLNMPLKSGRQTLTEIKADESLRDIPVIVLSTSEAEFDIVESYRNHAAAFVTKPVGIDDLIDKLETITSFWFTNIATLPISTLGKCT